MTTIPSIPAAWLKTDLATISTRHHDSELVAQGAYGFRAGYATLEGAVNHLQYLTRGDNAAGAAILEKGGRFFGVRVLEKIADARTSSGLRGSWLDIEDDSNVRIMPFNRHNALRAVVDGAKIVTEPAKR